MVALGKFVTMVLTTIVVWGLVGAILTCVWNDVVLTAWPSGPTYAWWHVGLVAFELRVVGILITGNKKAIV